MLYTLVMVIHIVVCLVLCVVVLLQSSKGGGLAGAFGGGGGAPQQIFGARGMTTILHKVTIYCAVGFFLTSSLLFLLTGTRTQAPESLSDALRDDASMPVTLPADDETGMPVMGDDIVPPPPATDSGETAPVTTDGSGDEPQTDGSGE